MKKIALVCEAYSSNLGDAFICKQVQSLIKSKGLDVVCVDLSGRRSFSNSESQCSTLKSNREKFKNITSFFSRSPFLRRVVTYIRWKRNSESDFKSYVCSILKDADGVVIGGGQILTDTNLEFPLRLQSVYEVCKEYQKPYVVFSVGVGDGLSLYARNVLNRIISDAEFVSVRGRVSRSRVCNLNHNVLVVENPDPVFYSDSNSDDGHFFTGVNGLYVGLNILSPSVFRRFVPSLKFLSDDDYRRFWYKVATAVCNEGGKCVIFTNGSQSDFESAMFVFQYLKAKDVDVVILPRPSNPSLLSDQINGLDVVVATRMHAGIKAYSLGKVVIPVGWDKKIDEVWGQIGIETVVPPSVIISAAPWADLLKGVNAMAMNDASSSCFINRKISHVLDMEIKSMNIGL